MADVQVQHGHQLCHQQPQYQLTEGTKSFLPDKGPSASQVVAVATLVPVGSILLGLAGITLTATVIGLALATPVFVIFSPVLVPAAIAIGLAVMGFLTSGAFGISGISSLSWIFNYMKEARGSVPEQIDYAKWRMQEEARGSVPEQIDYAKWRMQEEARGSVPEQIDYAKGRMQEAAGHVGQRTKEFGQGIQNKAAHEGGAGGRGGAGHEGGGRTEGGRT